MTYQDFELDKAYRVIKGNDQFVDGEILWVDSTSRALNSATYLGWLEPEECQDEIFIGAEILPALDYKVTTSHGRSRCAPVEV